MWTAQCPGYRCASTSHLRAASSATNHQCEPLFAAVLLQAPQRTTRGCTRGSPHSLQSLAGFGLEMGPFLPAFPAVIAFLLSCKRAALQLASLQRPRLNESPHLGHTRCMLFAACASLARSLADRASGNSCFSCTSARSVDNWPS